MVRLPASAAENVVPLSSLDLSYMKQGWGEPQVDKSVQGLPMKIGGRSFARGVGTHAAGILRVQVDNQAQRFTAWVGVDDETEGRGSVAFQIYGDGKLLFDSGVMMGGQPAKRIDISLQGVEQAILLTRADGGGINYDHANWAEAEFHMIGGKPRAVGPPEEKRVILTPPPGPEPAINGPTIYGATPNKPFIYRIPCTGHRPITFRASNLPESLKVDPTTGVIQGVTPAKPQEYCITFTAENQHGSASRQFRLVVGDQLALTPPMGWNSWYIHYDRVTEQHMRDAADAMIESGMADFGYQYVNIDDCWTKRRDDEPYRDETGAVLPNAKFPDIAGMVDYIHSKGLRAGTYISPGPWTCAGYVGSYEHEQRDARQFADWGFDFLKYDWCSYRSVAGGKTLEHLKKPYQHMGAILRTLDRDVVFNLCQYGMGDVWEWGAEVGGNSWRTTDDLGVAANGLLPGFYQIGLSNAQHWEHARPGAWNDPDYILIGWVGSARRMGEGEPTALTPNEQYSYMSMWSLMAAPLVFSGDMAKLDEFTLNVLCNAEVIEVDQDALGKQARIVRQSDEELVMVKPMEDGSLAVGLFNLGEASRAMRLRWEEIAVAGPRIVRDCWRHRDLGEFDAQWSGNVDRHGVALLRLRPPTAAPANGQ